MLLGMSIGAATMEISVESPQKTKNRVAIRSSKPTPEHILRQNFNSKRYMHPMFIALFKIAKTWRQPKCPLTDEGIKKMWYIYTMEYYSAVKRVKQCHLQQHRPRD